jgi:hypothetical protein
MAIRLALVFCEVLGRVIIAIVFALDHWLRHLGAISLDELNSNTNSESLQVGKQRD